MTFASSLLTYVAAIVGVVSIAIYFFGIPPELKRKLERGALKTMGENKASYMFKEQLGKVPTSNQEDVDQLKRGLGNSVGSGFKNPLGEQVGETGDRLSSPLTGR